MENVLYMCAYRDDLPHLNGDTQHSNGIGEEGLLLFNLTLGQSCGGDWYLGKYNIGRCILWHLDRKNSVALILVDLQFTGYIAVTFSVLICLCDQDVSILMTLVILPVHLVIIIINTSLLSKCFPCLLMDIAINGKYLIIS